MQFYNYLILLLFLFCFAFPFLVENIVNSLEPSESKPHKCNDAGNVVALQSLNEE